MKKKEAIFLFFRYLLLLIIGINFSLIYKIFTPITASLSSLILKLFYPDAILQETIILLKNHTITLIPACIAGAAYYLFLLLNLSTPMSLTSRIKSLFFLIFSFLFINVLRIVLFAVLFVQDYTYISFTHQIAWYGGSTILVILLWFVNIKMFSIKSIPFISDLKSMISDIKNKKTKKKR